MACAGALERLLGIVYGPFVTALAGEDADYSLIDLKCITSSEILTVLSGSPIDCFLLLYTEQLLFGQA